MNAALRARPPIPAARSHTGFLNTMNAISGLSVITVALTLALWLDILWSGPSPYMPTASSPTASVASWDPPDRLIEFGPGTLIELKTARKLVFEGGFIMYLE